jgi:serine protease
MPRIPLSLTVAAACLVLAGAGHAQMAAPPFTLLMRLDSVTRAADAWDHQLPYMPGEVVVKFKSGTLGAAESRALSSLRGPVNAATATWVGDAVVLATPGEPDAAMAADRLASQPEVEWAQPNYLRTLHATPNDPSYVMQWNFAAIGMPAAWDINPGAGSQVVVAVIDTGVTTTTASYPMPLWTGQTIELVNIPVAVSPAIAATRILPGRDFVFWNGPVIDLVGHGTHIAGTVLEETNNNLGFAGIAYGARLMPLKACYGYWEVQFLLSASGNRGYVDPRETGSCPDTAVSEAIRYAADNGAQVINLSLGGQQASPITREALQYAIGRGVFIATSNGNDFNRGNPVQYPAAYAAELAGLVSVGAVNPRLNRAPYSNTGAHLEVAAPGGDITLGAAAQIFQTGLRSSDFLSASVVRPRFDQYAEVPMQGTSMATPHVAGLAALLRSQGIRSPAAIEASIRSSARDLGTAGRDHEFGDGLIDARSALRGLGLVR